MEAGDLLRPKQREVERSDSVYPGRWDLEAVKALRRGDMNRKVYDFLKALALIWLPSIGTLYFGLATIWSLPYGKQILGSIMTLDASIGAVVRLASKSVAGADGVLWVNMGADKDLYTLDVSTPLDEIPSMNEIRLKVQKPEAGTWPQELHAL
jgi:hypothetical protein